ncbi:MAG: hypothetical protein LBG17_01065 [Bacteroidales bacterium]|jgi:hypothetical protein|nr:hypothetical protein [Bacteroidales bacterium]
MYIKFVPHNEIDFAAYDRCIEQSSFGTVYAMSWYLNAVNSAWNLLILDDYRYVMPLPFKRKFGIPYSFQPPFCQQLGLFSCREITGELLQDFLSAIPQRFYIVQLNSGNNFSEKNKIFGEVNIYLNYTLNLSAEYEKIKSRFHKNFKRNIKRAEAFSLSYNENIDIKTWQTFTEQYAENRPIKKMMPVFLNLFDAVEKNAKAEIVSVKNDTGETVACAIFMLWNNRAYYIVPVSSQEAKEKGAMSFLLNEWIKRHAQTPLVLDFEGSSAPNVARFYQSVGANEEYYTAVKSNFMHRLFNSK